MKQQENGNLAMRVFCFICMMHFPDNGKRDNIKLGRNRFMDEMSDGMCKLNIAREITQL